MNTVEKLFSEHRSVLPPEEVGLDAEIRGSEEDTIFSIDQNDEYDRILDKLSGTRQREWADDDEFNQIEGNIRTSGIDALAFYKSRRYENLRPYRGKWGIFYLRQGLFHIKHLLDDHYPGRPDTYDLAKGFLRSHEIYHFISDIHAINIELLVKTHLYSSAKRRYSAHPSDFIEEALANLHCYEWSKKAGIEDFAFDYMKSQPAAYSRFDEPPKKLRSIWSEDVIGHSALMQDHFYQSWLTVMPRALFSKTLCPEYYVIPAQLSSWISPSLVLPSIRKITDSEKVIKKLAKKYRDYSDRWISTKQKLIDKPSLIGLNFKPWTSDPAVPDAWSVRVNDGMRAHLRRISGDGEWETYAFGSHKELGHG